MPPTRSAAWCAGEELRGKEKKQTNTATSTSIPHTQQRQIANFALGIESQLSTGQIRSAGVPD